MGNDEHSQNVFKQGARAAGSIRWPTATRWSRSSATSGRSSTSRSTTSSARPSRATAPPCRRWRSACYDAGDIYEGVYEGWYCVVVRGVQAGEGSRRRHCARSTRRKPDWIREKNYFFRLSKYQRAAARRTSRRIPSSSQPDVRRNEILRLLEGGPRGHLGQPRRAVVGHPAAVRSRRASSTSGSTR